MDKNDYLKQYYGSYREDARLSAANHLQTLRSLHTNS